MLRITPTERVVLQMLANGQANREIADHLCVSEYLVEARLAELFRRMGTSSRSHAIVDALRRGLVKSDKT